MQHLSHVALTNYPQIVPLSLHYLWTRLAMTWFVVARSDWHRRGAEREKRLLGECSMRKKTFEGIGGCKMLLSLEDTKTFLQSHDQRSQALPIS